MNIPYPQVDTVEQVGFVPAQPGYRAWAIWPSEDGSRLRAWYVGEVVAWRLVVGWQGGKMIVARPITINEDDEEATAVEREGMMFSNEDVYQSFADWLTAKGARVCRRHANLAKRLYAISDDLIEASHE